MTKILVKVAVPIILVGVFAVASLIAIISWPLPRDFYVVLSLIAIFVFFSGLAIGQRLAMPVKKILGKAEELSKGNLSSRVDLETKDEFSDLAKAFNKIAEELQESHLQQANIEKSVDIKVRARTKELEETINALEQKVRNRTAELEKLIKEKQ